MHLHNCLSFAVVALCAHVSAHASHEIEHRDLKDVYYGPDSENINFLSLPKPSSAVPVDPKLGY